MEFQQEFYYIDIIFGDIDNKKVSTLYQNT